MTKIAVIVIAVRIGTVGRLLKLRTAEPPNSSDI